MRSGKLGILRFSFMFWIIFFAVIFSYSYGYSYEHVLIEDLLAYKSKHDGRKVIIGPLWVGYDFGDSFLGYQNNDRGKHIRIYWQGAKNKDFFKNLKGFSSTGVYVKGIYHGGYAASIHAEEGFYK